MSQPDQTRRLGRARRNSEQKVVATGEELGTVGYATRSDLERSALKAHADQPALRATSVLLNGLLMHYLVVTPRPLALV